MTATTQGRRAEVVAWQYRKNVKGRHWTYCSESIAAEFAGLSDYQTRALVPADTLAEMQRRVEELADSLAGRSDDAYLRYARALNADECKGKEIKMRDGKFGDVELLAHTKAAEYLSRSRALRQAANELRAILGGDGAASDAEVG